MYGGATQYPLYGTGPAGGMMTGATAAATAIYPYLQFGEGSGGAGTVTGGYSSGGQGYGVYYPPQLFQYSPITSSAGYAQHYGAPMSLAPSPALQSGLYSHIYTFMCFNFLIKQTTN